MKAFKPVLVGTLGLVAVASSILAWRQYQELVLLRIAARDQSSAGDAARIKDLERLIRDLRAQLTARGQTPADEGTPAEAQEPVQRGRGPEGGFARGGRGGRGPDGMREMMNNPQVQALRAVQQKGMLDQRYAGLFRQLNLPADKLEQFKTLLADRQATMADVMSIAREQGIDPRSSPEEFRKLMAATEADLNSSIKSLIGTEAFNQYQTYEQTGAQRNVVSQLERRLSYSTDPLTAAQSDQLVQILAATSPTTTASEGFEGMPPFGGPGGGRGGPGGPGGGGPGGEGPTATITTAAVAQAQSVLNTAQVDALKQLQQQQQAQQQLRQLVEEQVRTPNRGGQPAATGSGRAGG